MAPFKSYPHATNICVYTWCLYSPTTACLWVARCGHLLKLTRLHPPLHCSPLWLHGTFSEGNLTLWYCNPPLCGGYLASPSSPHPPYLTIYAWVYVCSATSSIEFTPMILVHPVHPIPLTVQPSLPGLHALWHHPSGLDVANWEMVPIGDHWLGLHMALCMSGTWSGHPNRQQLCMRNLWKAVAHHQG